MIKDLKSIIGESFTAHPNANSPWVVTEKSNDGEENYYRDVYGIDLNTNNTVVIYMYGESCIVKDINKNDKTVTLLNSDNDYLFEISFEQFQADFGDNLI